ncbi:MAG: HAMP domain-containing histidine kinase [Bdellovibrionaceae bacterium]|nr:HAMP domain-containing histidine kinase [Pseudobdellovibrionaceae bacterium]
MNIFKVFSCRNNPINKDDYQVILGALLHDLRTNLFITKSYLQIIRENPKDIEKIAKLQTITDNTIEFVSGISALESLKLGKLNNDEQVLNYESLVGELKLLHLDRMKEKSIELKVEIEKELPVLKVDPSVLKHHLLGNLLSNAIKFSYDNSEIILRIYKEEEQVCFSMIDSGMGIAADVQKCVFEWNHRCHSLGTKNEKGTGFGLAIVKNILNFYNADIQLISPLMPENKPGTHVKMIFKAP